MIQLHTYNIIIIQYCCIVRIIILEGYNIGIYRDSGPKILHQTSLIFLFWHAIGKYWLGIAKLKISNQGQT